MGWDSQEVARLPRGAKAAIRTAGIVVAAATAIAVGAYSWAHHQAVLAAETAELAKTYAINGAPCPTLTVEQYAALAIKPQKTFDFRGVRFARRFGHADCGVLGTKDPEKKGGVATCHFSGPAVLAVTSASGTFYFKPGVGYPATVFAGDGPASCVLASNFASRYR